MKASTIFDAKHLSDQDEATLIHLILILPHFPFGGGMLYLKSINFLKFCPHVQCLAERWTTTDGEQTCTPAAQTLAPAVSEIRTLLETSRKNVAQQVNQELLSTYWKIGEVIVRYEQNDSVRAAYGEKTLLQLSKALTKELGRGFSRSNLQNMRLLYLNYPICQTVSGKLSWSHYCELLSISDKEKRSFYEKEAVNAGWSVRELRRQMESSLFERLLLSRGDANKEQVLALAEYALGGLSNQIFASRYVLYMPNKEQLIKQVEEVLKRWHSREGD